MANCVATGCSPCRLKRPEGLRWPGRSRILKHSSSAPLSGLLRRCSQSYHHPLDPNLRRCSSAVRRIRIKHQNAERQVLSEFQDLLEAWKASFSDNMLPTRDPVGGEEGCDPSGGHATHQSKCLQPPAVSWASKLRHLSVCCEAGCVSALNDQSSWAGVDGC